MGRGEGDRIAFSQFHEVERPLRLLDPVDLVHDQQRRHPELPDPHRDRAIRCGEARLAVDEVEDRVRAFQRREAALLHALGEPLAERLLLDPAGIDELPVAAVVRERRPVGIARHARHVVDDRQTAPEEPVEKRRLSGVGTPGDRDDDRRPLGPLLTAAARPPHRPISASFPALFSHFSSTFTCRPR